MRRQAKNCTAGKTILAILAMFVSSAWYNAQSQCIENITTFQPGEKLVYDAYYNWGFIWIKVGEAIFEVNETSDGKSLELRGYGGSFENYDWIYKVREDFRVTWDRETLLPREFSRVSTEGKYEVHNRYTYAHDSSLIYTEVENSEMPLKQDTLTMPGCTYDVLSAIYYARDLDFSPYQPEEKIPVNILLDNKVNNLYIRYLGEEDIKLKTKDNYHAIVFRPLLVKGTIFKGGEDMTVWVTNDANRIPLMVEAKILVGSVKAVLRSIEGNRYPLDAFMPVAPGN